MDREMERDRQIEKEKQTDRQLDKDRRTQRQRQREPKNGDNLASSGFYREKLGGNIKIDKRTVI